MQSQQNYTRRSTTRRKKKRCFKKSDLYLIIVILTAFFFTKKMINIYEMTGGIPDTLVGCVFAMLGGECGFLAWIKDSNNKHEDREYQLADRQHEERREDERIAKEAQYAERNKQRAEDMELPNL